MDRGPRRSWTAARAPVRPRTRSESSAAAPGSAEGRSRPPAVPEIARPLQPRLAQPPSPALAQAPGPARWTFDSDRCCLRHQLRFPFRPRLLRRLQFRLRPLPRLRWALRSHSSPVCSAAPTRGCSEVSHASLASCLFDARWSLSSSRQSRRSCFRYHRRIPPSDSVSIWSTTTTKTTGPFRCNRRQLQRRFRIQYR